MCFGVSVLLRRLTLAAIAPVLAALPLSATLSTPAQAQAVLTCATISLFNFDPVPAGTVGATRTETVQLSAGDQVTVSWGGLTAFFWSVDGATAAAGGATGTATYNVSTGKAYVFFKSVTGGPGFVRFTCASGTTSSGGPATTLDALRSHQGAIAEREPRRIAKFLEIFTHRNALSFWGYYNALYRRLRAIDQYIEDYGHAADTRDIVSERDQVVRQLDALRNRSEYDAERASREEAKVRQENQFAVGFPIFQVLEYAPRRQSPINPTVSALSKFFDNSGDGTASATIPLQSTNPDWAFDVVVDGAVIDRTFAALSQQTRVGSITLVTSYQWDEETVVGGGIKLGGASTTFGGGSATISSTQFGLDLAIARMLTPDISGALYGGYEFGSHIATLAGVTSPYQSHTLKFGGALEGTILHDAFTITPSVSWLLQYYHQPAFTDGAGAAVALTNTLDLDLVGGVTIARDFRLVESDVTITPSLTLNGWLDYSASTAGAGVIPSDAFKLQVIGSIAATWDGGATLSLSADLSRGATSTMYGASVGLSVPIE